MGSRKPKRRNNRRQDNDRPRRGRGTRRGDNFRGGREITGILSMNRDGNAFLVPDILEEGKKQDDIFIPARRLRGALHGDSVRAVISSRKVAVGRRAEGEVIFIIDRSKRPYVGILQMTRQQAWVITESKNMPFDIEVPIDKTAGAQNGEKVAVLVTDFNRKANVPIGEIVDVLGAPGENDTEMHAILAEFGLPYRFEPEVAAEADAIPSEITEEDLRHRKDFRKICTFTIDPADAKDFDDALSVRSIAPDRWEIGIHIADVSHYVQPDSLIDKEAYARGTSVYLVDRTVPMLPENLCNALCSLRPNEDKLCFSAVFEIDQKAKIRKTWLGRTVICSDYRFAYEQAQAVLDDQDPQVSIPVPEEVSASLKTANALATILRKERFAAGAVSFERPEIKVIVDEKGKPLGVAEKTTTPANWLIEEFMLLANKAVAEYGGHLKAGGERTFVYRIHEAPDPDKITAFRNFMHTLGHNMPASSNPREWAGQLNTLLAGMKDRPESNAIEIMALRSMARAVYSTRNAGHYGLAFDNYTHFTSPIRRYPDLMVHRLLARYLQGGKPSSKETIEPQCQWLSQREQLAVEAERASIKYKMAEFMMDKVGQVFDATISGLTEWGMYAELTESHIEGMILLREMESDYYIFDADNYCLIGRSTRKRFVLGQAIKVRLKNVNLEQKLIDFEWVPDNN